MMFNFILLTLGTFVIGSLGQNAKNGPSVLGSGGSGSSPLGAAAFGPAAPNGPNFDPTLNAPGPLGQGSSGFFNGRSFSAPAPSGPSSSNVAPANAANGPTVLGSGGSGRSPGGSTIFGSPLPRNANFDPTLNAPTGLGQGGSGSHPIGLNAPVNNGPVNNGPPPSGAVAIASASNGQLCGPTEVYNDCGVGWQCEDYCGRGAVACAQPCAAGCYCAPGYIRSGPEYTAECIPEDQCPRALDPGPGPVQGPEVSCRVNEVFNECGCCDQYCNREPIICTADCKLSGGCCCKPGFVRSFRGGICIPKNKCPGNSPPVQGPPPPSKKCGKNEEYKICGRGSKCQDYCGRGANACAYCEDGCYCKKNFIRSGPEPNSRCIPETSCPKQCGANEEFNSCNGCDQFCGAGPIACTAGCGNPGCYCKSGYKRTNPGGKCIKSTNCPRAMNGTSPCPRNEVYKTCGAGSECEDYCGRGANACFYCEAGCYCAQGYIRSSPDYKSKCILQDMCSPQCQKNEEFNACNGCDQFCGSGPIACTAGCGRPGCYCKKDYIRSKTGGTCIKSTDCDCAQNSGRPVLGPGPVRLPLKSKKHGHKG